MLRIHRISVNNIFSHILKPAPLRNLRNQWQIQNILCTLRDSYILFIHFVSMPNNLPNQWYIEYLPKFQKLNFSLLELKYINAWNHHGSDLISPVSPCNNPQRIYNTYLVHGNWHFEFMEFVLSMHVITGMDWALSLPICYAFMRRSAQLLWPYWEPFPLNSMGSWNGKILWISIGSH